MSNTPASFKQIDVTRAVKGTLAAGLPVAQVEIDQNGKIVIQTGHSQALSEKNEWD